MARNGSGTYNLPAGNPVSTGSTISSSWANSTLSDIASALTGSIAADGQTTPTANLLMGTYAHTNVGNATDRTMYASAGQVQDSVLTYLTSVSGTNAITASAPVVMTAYATGQTFQFIASASNTGATTININSIGLKSITRDGTTALVAGDIVSGGAYQLIYDGTQFQLTNSSNASVQVTSFSAGTTGLTPSTATTGAITLGGTLGVANGGTGLTSLTANRIPYGNGTSAFSNSANLTFNGTSLGVGTASPTGTLEVVASSANNMIRLTRTTSAAGSGYIYANSTDLFGVNDGTLYPFIVKQGALNNSLVVDASSNTIVSNGNLGIGTASPARKLDVNGSIQLPTNSALYIKGSDNYFYADSSNTVEIAAGTSGKINLVTNGASRAILDSSGNLGIGTASPAAPLTVVTNSSAQGFSILGRSSDNFAIQRFVSNNGSSNYATLYSSGANNLIIETGGSERMRIASNGNLLVGTTTDFGAKVNGLQTASNLPAGYFINSSSPTGQGVIASYTYATASGSAIGFILGSGNGSIVTTNNLFIYTNGNVVNTNNSYGAISDIKLKENIVDASPKLDDLCKVKVRNYTLISDESKTKQLGVIAQELEEIFPSLIETQTDKDIDGNDLGTTTKQVKYSVFVPMLIKAMQEQQAMIDELKAKVAALEAK